MTFIEHSLWARLLGWAKGQLNHPIMLSGSSGPWAGGAHLAHSSQGLDAAEYFSSLDSR